MASGPGKYDDLATLVRKMASATGVIVLVLDGKLGHGMSVQAPPDLQARLPEILRYLAQKMEHDRAIGRGGDA